MPLPVVTAELADRLERSEAEYMASDMAALRTDDDNPLGVDVARFGDATALAMTGLDDWEFNRTIGLRDHGPAEIDSVLSWYRERRVDCHFDVAPMLCSERVRLSLAERGFFQSRFHTVLYGEPAPARPDVADGVDVTEVGANDMGMFAELYMVYLDDLNLAPELRRGRRPTSRRVTRCRAGGCTSRPSTARPQRSGRCSSAAASARWPARPRRPGFAAADASRP